MSDNQCVACGQWSGKGHRCPTPAATTAVLERPVDAPAQGYASINVGERVNRAQEAIQERQAAKQALLQVQARERLARNGEGVAYVVERNGKPVGVVYMERCDSPDNPRDYFIDNNASNIGMIRHTSQFGSLNELNWSLESEDTGMPERLDITERDLREEYPNSLIVPLRADAQVEHLNIATRAEIAARQIDGYAVIERHIIDDWHGGDEQAALDNFREELKMYSDYAAGDVWELTYESSVPGEETERCVEYGSAWEISDHVPQFLKDYTDGSNTLGTRLV